MKINLFIIGSVTLISYWTWLIFSQNLLIGILCLLLSFLFLLYINNISFVVPQRLLMTSLICLWIILSGFLLTTSFDKDLFHMSENRYITVLKRQEIYSREFGQFYRNRFGVYYFNTIKPFVYRYISNIANIFDLENLFISSYTEVKNNTLLPLVFLPFMVVGLFHLIKNFSRRYIYITIIILGVSGLLNTKSTLGPIIVYPIIYASIGLAFSKFLKLVK